MVQKVFGICEAKNGTETDELLQVGTGGHWRAWWGLGKGGKRLLNKFEMEGFVAQKRFWNLVGEKVLCGIGESHLRKRVTSSESIRLCMKKIS